MPPQPHVSAAIRPLRSWVTIAATLVVLASLTQALTFGFVHFTDVRTAAIEPAPPTDLTVIGGTAPLQGPGKVMEIPMATSARRSAASAPPPRRHPPRLMSTPLAPAGTSCCTAPACWRAA